MKYSIITFGCRVNQADSMAIEQQMRARDARVAGPAEADVVIVNSCSVTASADQGTRQAVRRVARQNPGARIVVTGCYASRCPDEVGSLPGVVRVVGNDRKERLAESLAFFDLEGTSGPPLTTADRYAGADGPCGAPPPFLLGRTTLTIRVQTGCDERCSYCIIPTTRGSSRSKPAGDVVRELRNAERAGYREVTLTGVHLGAYGRDLSPPSTLASLLRQAVHDTDSLVLRLGSLEPMDVPPALVELAASGRIAPAFHLPLQHASDRLLARMRRPYTSHDYGSIVQGIRERLPHAAIGSDVIVGFPGETEEDFASLCAYLERSPLTALHVFPYSDRPGTGASRLPGRVPPAAVRARSLRARQIGGWLSSRFRDAQAGSIRPALTIEDGSVAVTDNGIRTRIVPTATRNQRVRLRLGPVESTVVAVEPSPGSGG